MLTCPLARVELMTVHRTEQSSDLYGGSIAGRASHPGRAIVAAQTRRSRPSPTSYRSRHGGEDRRRSDAAGGRLIYVGAGSSGLLAQVDALEFPGTYGIEAERVPVLLAGGDDALLAIPSEAEDDEARPKRRSKGSASAHWMSCSAVSASGRTPYTSRRLKAAKARGALTIGMASNPAHADPTSADHAMMLATPPEVIAGSTRMNAGTAQKCALNMLSTLIGIRLGHVYDGHDGQVWSRKRQAQAAGGAHGGAGLPGDRRGGARPPLADRAGNEVNARICIGAGRNSAARRARSSQTQRRAMCDSAFEAMAPRKRHKAG